MVLRACGRPLRKRRLVSGVTASGGSRGNVATASGGPGDPTHVTLASSHRKTCTVGGGCGNRPCSCPGSSRWSVRRSQAFPCRLSSPCPVGNAEARGRSRYPMHNAELGFDRFGVLLEWAIKTSHALPRLPQSRSFYATTHTRTLCKRKSR